MRINKKTIGFAVKLSKDYNTVEASEQIELEFNAEEKVDQEAIEVLSINLRERCMEVAKNKIELIVGPVKPSNKDLEDNDGKVDTEPELVI